MQTSLARMPSPLVALGAPFADLDALARRLGAPLEGLPGALDMRMDVEEEDGRYTVAMDIPGVRKEDIDVSVSGNMVTVRAHIDRSVPASANGGRGKKLLSERVVGESVRSFTLPVDVDATQTTAAYEDGALTLTLPKRPDGQRRRIEVS